MAFSADLKFVWTSPLTMLAMLYELNYSLSDQSMDEDGLLVGWIVC